MKPKNSVKPTRGRPAHVPTAAMRRNVSIAAGGGVYHEDIAVALGIGTDSLRKHYQHELSVGACQRRMEALCAMHKAAKGGSVAAQKAYMALTPRLAAPPAPAPTAAPDKPAPTKPVGKKEQAQVDAGTAQQGTGWETLLPTPGSVQ
jgi:hypothetical protein